MATIDLIWMGSLQNTGLTVSYWYISNVILTCAWCVINARTSENTTSRASVSCPVKPVRPVLSPRTQTTLKVAVEWCCLGWGQQAFTNSSSEWNVVNRNVTLVWWSTSPFKNDLQLKNILINQHIHTLNETQNKTAPPDYNFTQSTRCTKLQSEQSFATRNKLFSNLPLQ